LATTGLLFVGLVLAAACSGSDGATGAAGPAGAAGAAGQSGQTGVAGPAGSAGPAGPAGSSFDAGGEGGLSLIALSDRARQGLAIAPVPLALAGKTPAQIEQIGIGAYYVNAVSVCGDCHTPSPDKYLAGGLVFPLDGAGHTVATRNLTPDVATGLRDTEGQFLQAERNGTDVLNVGSALIVHPWQYSRWLSTDDLKAIYAFLTSIPAVSNSVPADNKAGIPAGTIAFPDVYNEGAKVRPLPPESDALGPIPDPGNLERGLTIVPLDIPPPSDPITVARYARGSYIVNAATGCAACHSNPDRNYADPNQPLMTANYLTGGRVFPTGPAAAMFGVTRSMSANLVGSTNGFFRGPNVSFAVFAATITRGVHADEPVPDGGTARPLAYPMPARFFRNMVEEDLLSLYTYLKHVADNANITGAADKITQEAARYCPSPGNATGCQAGETCDASHECVGRACTKDTECDACQTCDGTNHCVVPSGTSTCVTQGI
jgi:hypothetical protein